MNRSKAKGTSAETAVVKYLQSNGFPYAERRALAGANDKGDVANVPGVVIEVKSCARHELAGWIDEARQEAANADVDTYCVFFKRRGTTDPGRWFVLMDGETFVKVIR